MRDSLTLLLVMLFMSMIDGVIVYSSDAVLLFQQDSYHDCNGSSIFASTPQAVAGTCIRTSEFGSNRFNCTTNEMDLDFTSGTCAKFTTKGSAACHFFPEFPYVQPYGYSCAEYPDENVILMTEVRDGCTSPTDGNNSSSTAMLVNTCLIQSPSFKVTGWHKVRVLPQRRVKYEVWVSSSSTWCSGSPDVTYDGELDKCVNNIGFSRTYGFNFRAAVPGTQILPESTNPTTSPTPITTSPTTSPMPITKTPTGSTEPPTTDLGAIGTESPTKSRTRQTNAAATHDRFPIIATLTCLITVFELAR